MPFRGVASGLVPKSAVAVLVSLIVSLFAGAAAVGASDAPGVSPKKEQISVRPFSAPPLRDVDSETGAAASPVLDNYTVMAIQRGLNRTGFPAGPVDGVIGPKTREAAAAYRRNRGMAPGGADAELYRHLRSELAPGSGVSHTAAGPAAAPHGIAPVVRASLPARIDAEALPTSDSPIQERALLDQPPARTHSSARVVSLSEGAEPGTLRAAVDEFLDVARAFSAYLADLLRERIGGTGREEPAFADRAGRAP